MDMENALITAFGFHEFAETAGDMGGGIVLHEAAVELFADRIRIVEFSGDINGLNEARKALGILRSSGWKPNVLPFPFSLKELPLRTVGEVALRSCGQVKESMGSIKFKPKREKLLDYLKMSQEIKFRQDQQPLFVQMAQMVRQALTSGAAFSVGTSPASPVATPSAANLQALEKLGELRAKGIITEEEFSAKKKQILGI